MSINTDPQPQIALDPQSKLDDIDVDGNVIQSPMTLAYAVMKQIGADRVKYITVTNAERARIVNAIENGKLSMAETSEVFKVPYGTVSRICREFKQRGTTDVKAKGGPLNVKMSDEGRQLIKEIIDGNMDVTMKQLQLELKRMLNIDVSISTIYNHLQTLKVTTSAQPQSLTTSDSYDRVDMDDTVSTSNGGLSADCLSQRVAVPANGTRAQIMHALLSKKLAKTLNGFVPDVPPAGSDDENVKASPRLIQISARLQKDVTDIIERYNYLTLTEIQGKLRHVVHRNVDTETIYHVLKIVKDTPLGRRLSFHPEIEAMIAADSENSDVATVQVRTGLVGVCRFIIGVDFSLTRSMSTLRRWRFRRARRRKGLLPSDC